MLVEQWSHNKRCEHISREVCWLLLSFFSYPHQSFLSHVYFNFLAYVYSLITCLMLFHKTVPPSKGRWWYTFFLVLPCLCPFPILYKWVESLECSCTWQPELENDVYVGYIWRIYTMYVLGAGYQARTSQVFISRSSPGFTSCYGLMRNSNKLGTQMSVWRILLFHMGLRLSMVKRSIPWTCTERIQLIWNVRSTFNLCPWLWWFEWECPPPQVGVFKNFGLVGGGVSLGTSFEVSKANTIAS